MKKQIIIGLIFLISGIVQAQESGSYLHFNGGVGLHDLNYNLKNGTEKWQPGVTINAAYSYFFNSYLGLQSGLGIQSFSALSTLNYISSTPDVDTDGDSYLFKTNFINWQEKQDVFFLDIPLVVQCKFPLVRQNGLVSRLNDKFKILVSLGAKISIPVNASYKTAKGKMLTSGYYSKWNVEYKDLPLHGFSTSTDSYKGNLSFKPSYMATADLGTLYTLSDKADLYFGGYLNYGLNNILKADHKIIYEKGGVYNGILASPQTDNVTPISIGIKVGVYMRLRKESNSNDNGRKYELPLKKTVALSEPIFTPKNIIIDHKLVSDTAKLVVSRNQIDNRIKKLSRLGLSVITFKDENGEDQITAIFQTDILFKFDSYELNSKATKILSGLVEIINDIPKTKIQITGHTDNIGKIEYNNKLSLNRAKTIAEHFKQKGIDGSFIKKIGKGASEPISNNNDAAGRAKNRRVEISFSCPSN